MVLPFVCIFVYVWWMNWCLFDFITFEYFSYFFSFSYVKRITIMSWGGGGNVALSCPHPTYTRCRGKVCTRDLTCDICAGWSSAQWEAFAKKRSYAERKRSRPSGSLPTAPKNSPRVGLLRKSSTPRLLLLPSLQEGRLRGRGLGMQLVLRPVRLPLLSLDLGPARGVEVSLVARPVRASALLSPLLLWELGRGGCLFAADAPCPLCFLGCLSPLITARSATW